MRIVLVTYGSRGDVQPMIALALALRAKGHEITLVAPPENKQWAESLRCPFQSIGSDMMDYVGGFEKKDSFKWMHDTKQRWINEIDMQFRVLPKVVANADLILSSSLIFSLASIAEVKGIAYRDISLCPQWLRSAHHPVPFVGLHTFPKWYNRFTWDCSKFADRFLFLDNINHHRKRLGLKPVQEVLEHITGRHAIVATDPAISTVPKDVAVPFIRQTGYMHLSQPRRTVPELEDFLRAGPPPVYAGFGSMSAKDQQQIAAAVIKAARSAGRRVVIAKTWNGSAAQRFNSGEDIFFIDSYPHLDLFPRMAAVIHHGGAGTTATAAVSGVPQIIVPYILDQFYWGHHIYRSGLGPKPIWRIELRASKLAKAISETVSNQTFQHNAAQTAARIKATNGIENTIQAILDSLE